VRLFALACVLFAASAGTAAALRQPTLNERSAITAALPAGLRAVPAGCLWFDITITNNGRYAEVEPTYLVRKACIRYAANGFLILHKVTRWKIIWSGSDPPYCRLHVPRELVKVCLP
jgi:hypothetical protein